MIPQQSQHQSQPNDPSSGNSWTSWATSNVSSNLPAGTSTLLEKASQLAYTAAESASHIASNAGVVGVGGGIGGGVTAVLGAGGVVVGGSTAASYFNHNANLNVNAEGLSMIGVSPGVDMSPGVDNKQQIESTSGAGGSAKQYNFANLFISSPTESNKMAHESSQDLNQVREERTDSKLPSEDTMMMPIETPDTSAHPTTTTTATAISSSTLATDAKEYAAELQSSQQQKLQQQQ